MNIYFAIIAKKGKGTIKEICPSMENQINDLMHETMFDYVEPTSSVEYSDGGKSALFLFSIRGEKLFDAHEGKVFEHFAITNSGYPMDKDRYVEFLQNDGCSKEYVSQINGIFSLCVLDKGKDEVRVYNNHMRLENVYYAESEDFYFVSTRALLLSRLISESGIPEIDKNCIVAFCQNGYVSTRGTAFKGVTELPMYSELKATPEGFKISNIEDLNEEYSTIPLTDQVCDEITHELLKAAERVKPLYSHAKMGLTGGKDSRMMILAMNKVGADIEAETIGYEDTPDVLVAQKIANMLGIEHSFHYNATVNDGIMYQDILGRTQRVLFSSDCSVCGYEGCAGNKMPYATDYAMFHGLGGEILRGGYNRSVGSYGAAQIEKRAKSLYNNHTDFFYEDAFVAYERKYLEGFGGFQLTKPESLDYVYVTERMGKWASSTTRCRGINRLYLMPLCDEQLIKKVLKIKVADRIDDRLIFEIIGRLDSRFLTVPLAGNRWTFEKEGPYQGDIEGYNLRTPVVAETKRAGFAWRKCALTDMRESMASVIFDPKCDAIFEYLKRDKVEEMFSEHNEEYAKSCSVFAWNIYTVAVMLEGSWYTNHNGKAGGFADNAKAREKAEIVLPDGI